MNQFPFRVEEGWLPILCPSCLEIKFLNEANPDGPELKFVIIETVSYAQPYVKIAVVPCKLFWWPSLDEIGHEDV